MLKTAINTSGKATTTAELHLCFGGFSSAGKKSINQDAFAALIPPRSELTTKGAVAAIADGVSSANKAAEASQLAVTQFINEYYATPETWSTEKSAAKVLNSLNQWLYSQGGFTDNNHTNNANHQQWLTTFSALVIKSSSAFIFHIGDSRISKFCQNQLETITHDHNRKQGLNNVILTRALGADHRLQVDVHKLDIQAGDFYILTCDGVHDFISDKALASQLKSLPSSFNKKDLEQVSEKIVQQAIKQGSDDNVSCLLVYIKSVPNRELAEIERDLLNRAIPPALTVGVKIDDFMVKKVIHASIRSHLYLVERTTDNSTFVLKAPSANFVDDSYYLQGFMREAWVGERINHNHVMQVKSAQTNSKFLYHLCEYIDGQTLSEWMHDNPKPSIGVVRDIIRQIISALRVFQRLELVHRDLKPDNIMINALGQIKLIDYGTVSIASLEENQDNLPITMPQGSLNFIAPETLLTLKTTHQSDLFSLGVICYQMLCGELPYKPMKRAEINFTHYHQWHYRSIKQFRAELPIWLDLALQQATQADPTRRYDAFSRFETDLCKPNLTAVDEYKTQPLLQRNPIKFWQGVSAVLFIALIVSMVI
jgi:protein phosphatase